MINNKQISVWRGTDAPPTVHHIWLLNMKMLIHNGTDWVTFVDDSATIEKVNQIIDRLDALELSLNSVNNYTINSKLISSNPVLNADDLTLNKSGTYVTSSDKVSESVIKIDTLLTTQVIE